jgi:hypothetical protein
LVLLLVIVIERVPRFAAGEILHLQRAGHLVLATPPEWIEGNEAPPA